mmetsp:Transcript_32221/g.47611  ORF Transcript_32221/g.47611 Transcript_32221/m.47611 type:complete len:275 (+) Transcript_32221:65-889(+)
MTNCDTPLRICCYGSSNKTTLDIYLNEAYSLGRILGTRNHTCVNGGGSTGCMGSMNQGVMDVNGKVVGVIHEMFVKKGSSYVEGCHDVFKQKDQDENVQLIVVGGKDLQERKRMLVKDADALVVLPGGPGTFDELWEMACARQIGFIQMPIVCVNVNGYYDSFKNMLERAHKDKFLYKNPNEILHFEETSAKAVKYVEDILTNVGKNYVRKKKNLEKRPSTLQRMMSAFNVPSNFVSTEDKDDKSDFSPKLFSMAPLAVAFLLGVSTGFILQRK